MYPIGDPLFLFAPPYTSSYASIIFSIRKQTPGLSIPCSGGSFLCVSICLSMVFCCSFVTEQIFSTQLIPTSLLYPSKLHESQLSFLLCKFIELFCYLFIFIHYLLIQSTVFLIFRTQKTQLCNLWNSGVLFK